MPVAPEGRKCASCSARSRSPGSPGERHLDIFDGSNTGEGYVEQTFDCGSDGSAMCTITVDYKYEKGPFDQGEGGKVHIYIDGEMKLTEYTEMCWDCQRRHASRIKALYRWVR